ncbi:MAG: acyltransferase [Erysipelotrichaceae bacterium]|nr:acyltransferase [Erysipelotrichaceae bacterium]
MSAKTKADNRNYALDFIRVIAAFLMTTFHWMWWAMFPGAVDNGYWGAYKVTQLHSIAQAVGIQNWDWFKGTYTMGFFVFVTGYFLMDGFKRAQAKGAFNDPRTHFTHTWRFTAKTYCAYAPLVLFGVTFGFILTNIQNKTPAIDWLNNFVWNIFQFAGFHAFGMWQDNATVYVNNYCPVAWYIEAFIVGACIFYAILVHSERVAVFVWCPLLFMMSNIWLNRWLVDGVQTTIGITDFLPQDYVRLWGPLALGIWGWYIVDAIKKADLSEGACKALGVAWLVALAYALVTSWTGYFGGMLHQDVVWMFIAMIVIAQRDPVTRGLNAVMHKFPLAKYFGDFSGGMYLVHQPILFFIEFAFAEKFGWTAASWMYEGLCCCGAILFIIVNNLLLKPMYGKLSKVLHARDKVEPRIFGEQA